MAVCRPRRVAVVGAVLAAASFSAKAQDGISWLGHAFVREACRASPVIKSRYHRTPLDGVKIGTDPRYPCEDSGLSPMREERRTCRAPAQSPGRGQPAGRRTPVQLSILAEDRNERVAPWVIDLAVGQFQLA